MAVPRNPNKFTLTRAAVVKTAAVVREAERAKRAKDLTSGGYEQPHAPQKAIVTVKVTRVIAGGKAEAIVQAGGITPDNESWPTEDIDMPEDFEAVKDGKGEAITEFNCYLVDYAGGAFVVDQYYPCVRWGTSKNKDAKENPYPIMEVLGEPSGTKYGKVESSVLTGTNVVVIPCTIAGELLEFAGRSVWIKPDQSSYSLTNGTQLDAGTIVHYVAGGDGFFYLHGTPIEVMTNFQFNTSSAKLQKKTRNTWGVFSGTESDWIDIATAGTCIPP